MADISSSRYYFFLFLLSLVSHKNTKELNSSVKEEFLFAVITEPRELKSR